MCASPLPLDSTTAPLYPSLRAAPLVQDREESRPQTLMAFLSPPSVYLLEEIIPCILGTFSHTVNILGYSKDKFF